MHKREGVKIEVCTALLLLLTSLALFRVSLGRFEFAEALMSGGGRAGHHHSQQQHHARRTRQQRAVYLAPSSLADVFKTSVSAIQANVSRQQHMADKNNGDQQQQQQQQSFLQQDQPAVLEQCCACDEAKYELVFEGLWSRYTHPEHFPDNFWLAHFGDTIGASHSRNFRMWALDSYASEGVKELAETGATKRLESELKQVSAKTRTIIKARELRYPTLSSKTSAVFRTDRQHHLVSVLSKLGPSPDWMLGVSGLELCQADCSWAPQRVVNLHLLDAGTDSGTGFTSSNQPTQPQEKIHYYRRAAATTSNSRSNNDQDFDSPRSMFGDASSLSLGDPSTQFDGPTIQMQDNSAGAAISGEQMKPFARLTITRQRIYEKSCDAAPPQFSANNQQQFAPAPALVADYSPAVEMGPRELDCRFSDWSDWSTCSSQCGKGIRTRTRSFLVNPSLEQSDQQQQAGCQQSDLIEKEICLSECIGGSNTSCVTRDWSQWSKCSAKCGGQGYRKRTRAPISEPLAHGCESIELAEMEPCAGQCSDSGASSDEVVPQTFAGQRSNNDSNRRQCELTAWSQWSECPVACGRGTMIRVRQFVRREDADQCAPVKLIEKQPCQGKSQHCTKLADRGGNGGGGSARLGRNQSEAYGSANKRQQITYGAVNPELPVIDCKLSNWGPWSTCSAMCGQGKRMRSRYIIQMPQNGGKPCDKKLSRTQKCKDLPPCPPVIVNNNNNNGNSNHQYDNDRGAKSHHQSIQQQHHQHHSHHSNIGHGFRTTTTTTSTTTQTSSMMDDEDDSKFSKLIKSDQSQVSPVIAPPDWTRSSIEVVPSLYYLDHVANNNDMELIGSSNFHIKNGHIISSFLSNLSLT